MNDEDMNLTQWAVEIRRSDGVWTEWPGAPRYPDPDTAVTAAVEVAEQLQCPARPAQVTITVQRLPGGTVTPAQWPATAAATSAAAANAHHPPAAGLNQLLWETSDAFCEEFKDGRWRRRYDEDACESPEEAIELFKGRPGRWRVVERSTRVTVHTEFNNDSTT